MVKGTVTTVTLTANTPKAIKFSEAYPYYWIDNKSSGNVYVSTSGTPEADADGTYSVAAGAQLRISGGPYDSDIVLLGEGKVQVVASGIADCPFKSAPVKNGGGKYYIYDNGSEPNGNVTTAYHQSSSSGKKPYWISLYYYGSGVIATDLLDFSKYKRIGVQIFGDSSGIDYTPKFTYINITDKNTVVRSGADYLFSDDVNILASENLYDDTTAYGGVHYLDIPDGLTEGYVMINSVNVNVTMLELWLE